MCSICITLKDDNHFTFNNRNTICLIYKKLKPLWKVFHGCGQPFHIECLLPDICDSPVSKATLLAHVEALGKQQTTLFTEPETEDKDDVLE